MDGATIAALASGRPPAAIAVIRISGPQAHAAATALAGPLPPARRAALRSLRSARGDVLDEVLLLRFDGPASATGEDTVELHCHGGRAVVESVMAELLSTPGVRLAEPGEFTRRALAHGRIDLTEAEGLADLLEAETEAQRRQAQALAGGTLRRQLDQWRERLVMLSARAEAAIDYVGDEDETSTDEAKLGRDIDLLVAEWRTWLAKPSAEPLREGIRVVVAGPPNAGKSSLVNALVGTEKAIVSPIAGTTRDLIEVPVGWNGIPFVLVDTAGLRASGDAVEQIGVGLAERAMASADILLWLGDPRQAPDHPRQVQIAAMADLGDRGAGLAVSSVSGVGLESLVATLLSAARDLIPSEGDLALNRRQRDHLAVAAAILTDVPSELVLQAETLRSAREEMDRLSGRAGLEEMLDALFNRFCLGK